MYLDQSQRDVEKNQSNPIFLSTFHYHLTIHTCYTYPEVTSKVFQQLQATSFAKQTAGVWPKTVGCRGAFLKSKLNRSKKPLLRNSYF